ncbi:MAG: YggS family pyridoxal phosphate-dependent enzyme [Dehalococcoidia bacterium]|nr:YggS family pyridoxal phosphate-dependent enzyme [Dehalococcoidia bacterium]
MSIDQNIRETRQRIAKACERAGRSPEEITLVAVSKTVDAGMIEAAYRAGITDFGENRVQDALIKVEQLRSLRPGLKWHMVGHLQTNKARTAASNFDIIHSVDSLRLAETLNRCAGKIQAFVQVNIALEDTKGGFPVSELDGAIKHITSLPNIEVKGLMTIAPLASDAEQVRPYFRELKRIGDALGLKGLSMGMTDDFEVAIEEGATCVRIGRAIFGAGPA